MSAYTDEAVKRHRENMAHQRARSLPLATTAKKFIDGLDRKGMLVPGGGEHVLAVATNRHADGRPRSGPSRVTVPTLEGSRVLGGGGPDGLPPLDGPAGAFARAAAYLESEEGRVYLSRPDAADDRPAFKRYLDNLGVPVDTTEALYREHAVRAAGKGGADLARVVWNALAVHDGGRHLGVTNSEDYPRPAPHDPYAPKAPVSEANAKLLGRFGGL